MSFFAVLMSLSLGLSAQSTLTQQIQSLSYYTENYPPANFYELNKLKGISVDTLKLMWAHLGAEPQDIAVVPWARGYRNALMKKNAVLFTMSRTQEREKSFKWVGPVFSSNHVLVGKTNREFDIQSFNDVFQYRVATIRGDISEISLRKQGFPDRQMGKVSELKQAFLMLRNDRVDLMMISIHGLQHVLAQMHESRNKYQVVWRVNKIGNYFAFNKNTPDEVINALQAAFDAIEPQRIEIKQKYNLPIEEY